MIKMSSLVLYEETFPSRLLLGTGRYPSPQILEEAISAAQPAMITAALRRIGSKDKIISLDFLHTLNNLSTKILPNTAGCYTKQEAITTAQMAREVFNTSWIKLEIIGDTLTLQPNILELTSAAEYLIRDGFKVLPYCTEDLILCQKLVDVGCQAIMPWAAPIGTGMGPLNSYALKLLRERIKVPMIIDAGIGKPSHACEVMQWGYDGVLLNTAVALAKHPPAMAMSFSKSIEAGRIAYLAGTMEEQGFPQASTAIIGTPFNTISP